jgi:GDP-L-fucose synthase
VRGRKVLVTGGTGLIGLPLARRLLEAGARVKIVSLDDPSRAPAGCEFVRADLTRPEACERACEGVEVVFHLAGIKGSPLMAKERPASFFVPTLLFNTQMMEAARRAGVARYLYTSTIGVYAPADSFQEDQVWQTFPSQNDRFAGWAKRMGELQAEAYAIEHGWKGVSIVRPANVYGPGDCFEPGSAMVIPSLIRRAIEGESPLVVWGDGTPVRDFIHADDVASGMLAVMEAGETRPVNLGSGSGVSIRHLVEIVLEGLGKLGLPRPDVVWDTDKPAGDRVRLMEVSRAKALGIEPRIPIEEGVLETMKWYAANREIAHRRHDAFR